MKKKISRQEALALGLSIYFTGKPCKKNHISERIVSNGSCKKCISNIPKEKRKLWNSKYFQKNKEEYKKRYEKRKNKISSNPVLYERKLIYDRKRLNKWRSENKDKVKNALLRQIEKIKNDPILNDKFKSYQKKYRSTEEYKNYRKNYRSNEENKKKHRAYIKKWNKSYKGRLNSIWDKLRNRIKIFALAKNIKTQRKDMEFLLGCSKYFLTYFIELQFYDHPIKNKKMTWENKREWHIDHLTPLASLDPTNHKHLMASNHFSNLRPLWADENLIKNSKVIKGYGVSHLLRKHHKLKDLDLISIKDPYNAKKIAKRILSYLDYAN